MTQKILDSFEHLVEFLMVYYDMTFEEARQWYNKNKHIEDMEDLINLMENTSVRTNTASTTRVSENKQ